MRVGEILPARSAKAPTRSFWCTTTFGDASKARGRHLTRAVVEAVRLLDMRVHDHIIIGREDISSIKQNHPTLWV